MGGDVTTSSERVVLPLAPASAAAECRLCHGPTERQFQLRILGRHDVWYERCSACGSLQTEAPYWLSEAYASNISPSDVGAVDRCLTSRAVIWLILRAMGRRGARLLDFGGGSGLLCRLLRDVGIDAWTCDAHGKADYAQTYRVADATTARGPFDAVTAFEVFEHLAQPHTELPALFSVGPDVLIATTEIYQPGFGRDWWYLGPDTGQHVFFYSRKALQDIADRFGYALLSQGGWHVFSRRPLSSSAKALLPFALSSRGLKLFRMILEGAPHERYIARDYQVILKAHAESSDEAS